MQIIKRHIKVKKYLSLLFVLIIICNITNAPNKVMAAEPWVAIEGGTNGIQNTDVRYNTIVQRGVHNSADDNSIRYKTLYYKMAIQKYNISEKFTTGSNASIDIAYVPFNFGTETDNGTTKTTEYMSL